MRGDWNHFKINQTVPEQRTGKGGNQGTTQNSHAGHCTHTAGGANGKVQNVYQGEFQYTCDTP
jgi:hypothetical protein